MQSFVEFMHSENIRGENPKFIALNCQENAGFASISLTQRKGYMKNIEKSYMPWCRIGHLPKTTQNCCPNEDPVGGWKKFCTAQMLTHDNTHRPHDLFDSKKYAM